MRPLYVLSLCLFSGMLSAQTLEFTVPPTTLSRNTSEVGIADFDGDGINDIAVCGAQQRWYKGPDFTDFYVIGQSDGGPYAARVADMNNDGFPDFVTSDGAREPEGTIGELYVYLHPGAGGDPTEPWQRIDVYSGLVRHQNDMRLVDIDGDGRLDILEKTWSPAERVLIAFQNADINDWTVRTFMTGETGKPEGISAGDLDGDGDTEIVQSGVYWDCSGNWRTDPYVQYFIDEDWYASVFDKTKSEVGDINGDGALDVYIGSAEGSGLKLSWYENTGLAADGSVTWAERLIKDDAEDYHAIRLVDIDFDSDLDLVAGKGFGPTGVSVFYNDGNGNFTEDEIHPAGNLYTLAVGDLDDDGDLDIVGPDGFYRNGIKIYYNTTPTDPPAAPSALSATLMNGKDVELNWTDNSNDEGNFQLERLVAGNWLPLTTTSANVTLYLDETTQPGTTYRYRVRAANGGGASGLTESNLVTTWSQAGPVTATPPGGNYVDPPTVTLTNLAPGGTIRYTLDGSAPDENSTLYASPLLIQNSLTLKFINSGQLLLASEVKTEVYNIALNGNFPPVADAGNDRATLNFDPIALDGRGSTDLDDEEGDLSFSWRQISGAMVTIAKADTILTYFTPTLTDTFRFELSVSDEAITDKDTVTIVVNDLDARLVAYWPFDELTGDVAAELVAGRNAALNGGNDFVAGQIDNALLVEGTTGRAEAPPIDVPGDSMTITAWIRVEDLTNVEGRIISKASGTNGNDHVWMLSQNGGSALRFRLNTGGQTTTLVSNTGVLAAGEWTFVAGVYDGAEMRLYRNNELVASVAETGDIAQDPTVAVGIGNQPTGAGDRPFNGLIDDVRIYGAALTESELGDLYGGDFALPVSWRYFEGEVLGKTVALRWDAVSVVENTGFFIERRRANGSFEEIGFVGTDERYLFSDEAPYPGMNTYRLRQVDFSGRITYSSLLSFRLPTSLSVYPVPARNMLTIESTVGSYYQVVNALGVEVSSGQLLGARTRVQCGGWKGGVYLVKLMDDYGRVISERKIIHF